MYQEQHPEAYAAGFAVGNDLRPHTPDENKAASPPGTFGAYVGGEDNPRRGAYLAWCEGVSDGTQARWARGEYAPRERALLDRVHAIWRSRGIFI